MWYWYKSRRTELFLDYDAQWKLFQGLLALRRAIVQRLLRVENWWIESSLNKEHYHVVVVLREEMSDIERTAWEIRLWSDIGRATWDMMRIARTGDKTGILIRKAPLGQGFRDPDATCDCQCNKHITFEDRKNCEALQSLQIGEPVSQFFPVNRDRKRRKKLPYFKYGKQSVSQLIKLRKR
jgi:hypothetical protein